MNQASALSAILWLQLVVGSTFDYIVSSGDTLTSIGARFGVDAWTIAALNGRTTDRIRTGETLRIDNRHIVPESTVKITVNVPQRMIFVRTPTRVIAAPITAGRVSWQTPLGAFRVVEKETDPTWDVPVSIQREMRDQGRPVLTQVLPGPDNPLGTHWIGLSLGSLGVHGTNAPGSLFQWVSHGCIRVHPENIGAIYQAVDVDDPGEVIYSPVLAASTSDGVFLEVHPDPYLRVANYKDLARRALESISTAGPFPWKLVDELLERKPGIAIRLTSGGTPGRIGSRPTEVQPNEDPYRLRRLYEFRCRN